MLGKAINTIGLCIIGGKYILMLILAAMTVFFQVQSALNYWHLTIVSNDCVLQTSYPGQF